MAGHEKIIRHLREYLFDNSHAPIEEVAKESGVSLNIIRNFILGDEISFSEVCKILVAIQGDIVLPTDWLNMKSNLMDEIESDNERKEREFAERIEQYKLSRPDVFAAYKPAMQAIIDGKYDSIPTKELKDIFYLAKAYLEEFGFEASDDPLFKQAIAHVYGRMELETFEEALDNDFNE